VDYPTVDAQAAVRERDRVATDRDDTLDGAARGSERQSEQHDFTAPYAASSGLVQRTNDEPLAALDRG
jgi:hypothetical protein